MQPLGALEAKVGESEHSQVDHCALRHKDEEVEAAVVAEAGVLVSADGPVTDKVVAGDLEHYEDTKGRVSQNELDFAAHVALILFVDREVNTAHFIVLVCSDLPTLFFHVLTHIAYLNRKSAFPDVTNLVLFLNALIEQATPLSLIITTLIRRVRWYLV